MMIFTWLKNWIWHIVIISVLVFFGCITINKGVVSTTTVTSSLDQVFLEMWDKLDELRGTQVVSQVHGNGFVYKSHFNDTVLELSNTRITLVHQQGETIWLENKSIEITISENTDKPKTEREIRLYRNGYNDKKAVIENVEQRSVMSYFDNGRKAYVTDFSVHTPTVTPSMLQFLVDINKKLDTVLFHVRRESAKKVEKVFQI